VDSGIDPGAHVGILAYNRAEWAEAMIGCYKARVVPVNLNYRYIAAELRYVIDNADLEVLVFERALSPLVADSTDGPDAEQPLQLLVVEDGTEPAVVGLEWLRHEALPYEAALAEASPGRDFGPRSPDDLYVLYTGGTTGMPKGVLWRQEDIFFAAMGGGGWGAEPIRRAEELAGRINTDEAGRVVMLAVAPLMHGNAQWVMWSAFMMGGTAVLYTDHRYDPDGLWRLIGAEGVVSVGLVGDAMARPLAEALASAEPGTYDTSTLVVVGSGGAMLSSTVKDELHQLLPDVLVMDRFGSSESGAQGAVEVGAAGPRFVMSEDTSVLDEELVPLQPGDGRIGRLARSGRIPIGYYKDEAKTAATFPVDAHGVRWSLPGDLASVEPDGTIVVHGRGSASINSGGEKIFPEEVEAAVKSHPDVFDAIVVGLPDERFGERVAVVVLPRRGAAAPTLEDLQAHCRIHVAGYKVPRQLLVVEAIPLTAAGKPDAKAAKALF
jgi:fatty-acyl-CoA synthase